MDWKQENFVFYQQTYVREIVKEKIVEVEKPVPAKPGKEPKVQPSRESLLD